MLEHSIYTVASPEASASILWRDSAKAKDAVLANVSDEIRPIVEGLFAE